MRRMKSENVIYEGNLLEMYTEYGNTLVIIGANNFDYLEFEIYDFEEYVDLSPTYYRISKEALNRDISGFGFITFFSASFIQVFKETESDKLIINNIIDNDGNDYETVYIRIVGVK